MITKRQIDIVIQLAGENVIDPNEGEGYDVIAKEQREAIKRAEIELNALFLRMQIKRCETWNKRHPIGTRVTRFKLIDPLDDPVETKTRSCAWVTASGDCLVKVEGIAGGVLLESVIAKP